MSDRTNAGHPADNLEVSETLSTPCPSVRSGQQGQVRSGQVTLLTSSRSMALALVVETLRPDWSASDIAKALAADDRPWRTVVLASIRGAAGTDIRHPNGLRYVNPDGAAPTPVPPSLAEYRNAPRCDDHGAITGSCALCRRGIGDVS